MSIDYMVIGQRLQNRRKELRMTQEVLAEKAGITVVYLSKFENGHVRPTLELLDELCAALQHDLGMALTGAKTDSPDYGSERVLTLFRSCSPQVKPIALSVLEQLAKLK